MRFLELHFLVLIGLCLTLQRVNAQAPVITPKSGPIVLRLNAAGRYVVALADVATVSGVTDPSTQVQLVPASFDCNSIGKQTVTVVATNGTFGTPTTASNSAFGGPWNIAIDNQGNLFISDLGNNKFKEITPFGNTTTLGGNSNTGCNDGTGAGASFTYPLGVVADNAGNVYVSDASCNVVKKINIQTKTAMTIAGTGTGGYADLAGSAAQFYTPLGLAIDATGNNVYVADKTNERIRKINLATGLVTTFAGNGTKSSVDGLGTAASFADPSGLVFDKLGNLYVTDEFSNRIREISPAGLVTTIAGSGTINGHQDGPGNTATFAGPYGITIDVAGNLFVTDRINNEIRKIAPDHTVTTFAGNTAIGLDGGFDNGIGTAASFRDPTGITVDKNGNFYVADRVNHVIRRITPGGVVSTYAGTGVTGDINGDVGGAPPTGGQSAKDIEVTVLSTPVFSSYPDVVIPVDVTCNNALPDYTTNAKVTDNCSALKLNVTQVPAVGTTLPYNTPTKVTLTADDGAGGTASVSFNVTVTSKPVITPKQGPIVLTLDQNGNYAIQPTDIATVTSCITPTPIIKLSPANLTCANLGNQTISITADDGSGSGLIAQANVPVTVISSASLESSLGDDVIYTVDCVAVLPDYTYRVVAKNNCTGAPILFTQSPAAGAIVKSGTPIVVTVSTTSSLLGMSSFTFNVSVGQTLVPTVSVSALVNSVCKGTLVTFNAQVTDGGGTVKYQWMVNGVVAGTDNPQFTTDQLNNNDVVSCGVISGAGCVTPVLSNTVTMAINPLPTVALPPIIQINDGESVKLQPVTSGNIATYSWIPATGLDDATSATPTASPSLSTTYQLHVLTAEGCDALASTTVIVIKPITIPNTFTPNGDGINDKWNIKNLDSYLDCSVDVFNRYGQLMFHSNGYGLAWDGTSNGAKIPIGAYYYVIDLKNGTPKYSGEVTVLK